MPQVPVIGVPPRLLDTGTELTTLNYGLVGCGMMGQEHIRNIQLLPDTAIVGIFEPDAGMRQAAASLASDAQMVDSIEALLAIEALDCLCLLYTSPSPRDRTRSRMPSSA